MPSKTPSTGTNLKRSVPNPEQQQQRLSELDQQSAHAISALAQTGVNTINAPVLTFDTRLTQFERSTAKVLAERLRQSQLRIQQYLVAELSEHPSQHTDLAVLLDDALEVPDLNSSFLAIAPLHGSRCLATLSLTLPLSAPVPSQPQPPSRC